MDNAIFMAAFIDEMEKQGGAIRNLWARRAEAGAKARAALSRARAAAAPYARGAAAQLRAEGGAAADQIRAAASRARHKHAPALWRGFKGEMAKMPGRAVAGAKTVGKAGARGAGFVGGKAAKGAKAVGRAGVRGVKGYAEAAKHILKYHNAPSREQAPLHPSSTTGSIISTGANYRDKPIRGRMTESESRLMGRKVTTHHDKKDKKGRPTHIIEDRGKPEKVVTGPRPPTGFIGQMLPERGSDARTALGRVPGLVSKGAKTISQHARAAVAPERRPAAAATAVAEAPKKTRKKRKKKRRKPRVDPRLDYRYGLRPVDYRPPEE